MTALIDTDPFFTATGAALYLGLTNAVKHPAQAMRGLARKKKIKSTRIAGKLMFRKSWLEEFIKANQV